MAYATLEDLIARAGLDEILQVADRDGDLVADPEVVAAALGHADSVVNGYLAARYVLPLASVPELVNTWAVAVARYYLHREGPPDYVTADYKAAMAELRDMARGLLALPDATGAVTEASSGQHLADLPDEVFTPGLMAGWRQ